MGFQLKHVEEKDVNRGKELFDKIGGNYITNEQLKDYIMNGICIGVFEGKKMVGIVAGEKMKRDKVKQHNDEFPNLHLPLKATGLLNGLATDKNYRHRGIGRTLTHLSVEELKFLGCTTIFIESWVSGMKGQSQELLRKQGFKEIARVPNYWKKLSEEENFECPVCGIPCHCTAILFIKNLKANYPSLVKSQATFKMGEANL